jgi:hypothetical protein
MSALNWISIFTANYPSNWRLGNNLILWNIKFLFISKSIELFFAIWTNFYEKSGSKSLLRIKLGSRNSDFYDILCVFPLRSLLEFCLFLSRCGPKSWYFWGFFSNAAQILFWPSLFYAVQSDKKKTLRDGYTFQSNLTMLSLNPESIFSVQILFSRKFMFKTLLTVII